MTAMANTAYANNIFFAADRDLNDIAAAAERSGPEALESIDQRLSKLWKLCATTAGFKALLAGAATLLTITGVLAFPLTLALTALAVSVTVLTLLVGGRKWNVSIENLPPPLKSLAQSLRRFCVIVGIVGYSAARYLLPTLSSRENRELYKKLAEVQQAQQQGLPNPHFSHTRPIVMVHGFLDNSNNFEWLKEQLEKAGLGPIYTVDLGHPWNSIEDGYLEALNQKLQLIAAVHGRNDVALASFSMGGLVANAYACYAAKENNIEVTDVVQLAPPAQGTNKAWIGILATRLMSLGYKSSTACKQMRLHSPFVKALNDDLKQQLQDGMRLYTMGSHDDPIIQPATSSKYSAQSPEDHHLFDGMRHLEFLYSAAVVQKMVDYFFQRESEERCPATV